MARLILAAAALVSRAFAGPSLTETKLPVQNKGVPLNFLGNHKKGDNEVSLEAPVYETNVSAPKSMEMTAKEMEQTVMKLMLGKSAFGATPMGDSVQKIINIIKDTMEPKVEEAHESDQKQLIKLAAEISTCGTEKDSALEVAKVQLVKYEKESGSHQKCRGMEATMYTSKENCLAEQKSLLQVKQLKCKAFAAVSNKWGHVKHNAEIVKKGGSESVESYVTRLSTTFCGTHVHGKKGMKSAKGGWGGGLPKGMLDEYLRSKDACKKATEAWQAKVKECKKRIHDYNTKKSECNQFQSFMDGASCKRAVLAKDACEAYAGCYFNKKKAYSVVEGKVRFEEIDRKAEWRGLKRIGCLIDAFADGKVTNDEIGVCKNATWSTEKFIIDYPTIPALAKCKVPNLYPATEFYKKKEFAPLPAVAKGKPSPDCTGMEEISLTPRDGSPKSCKCERVTMNGYYSAGPLVKCTKCLDIRRSTQKSSCPVGTKLFSPASRADWKTFTESAQPLQDPHFIIDVTRPQNGCGGCRRSPMNSGEIRQKSWHTSDGSAWWLRSTKYNEPNGDYTANCFLRLFRTTNENHITFNDGRCNYHSKSYYCQLEKQTLTPAKGSPASCKCTNVVLAGPYSAGSLVRCQHCLDVRRSTQKNSCPAGMKLFAPSSKADWKTFFSSAAPLANPHWIVDVTRPQNGCGGCTRAPMKSSERRQATWRTSDGAPWWLRNTRYNEPNGDYSANCFLNLYNSPNENNIRFNDGRCNYHSTSYYCQPKMKKPVKKKAPEIKEEVKVLVTDQKGKTGWLEFQWYYSQNGKCRNLGRTDRKPRTVRQVNSNINYPSRNDKTSWPGFYRGSQYAVRWDGILLITERGRYQFILGSDDGSMLKLGKRFVINNDGYHGYRQRTSSLYTLGPVEHRVQVMYFQGGGDHRVQLQYKGPDTRNKVIALPEKRVKYDMPKGFKEEVFYPGAKSKVSDCFSGAPRQVRVASQVAYGSTSRTWPGFDQSDGFAVRWTGTLSIYRGGRYRFWIQSDDGSKLYVGDKLLVNNDGRHGMRTRYGDKMINSKNDVALRLEYFEATGGAGMLLKFMGKDTRNKLRYIRSSRVKAPF